jgi:hypothetical protein
MLRIHSIRASISVRSAWLVTWLSRHPCSLLLLPAAAAAAAAGQVHVHPKRFPAAYTVDWRQCVLADRPEYVVVDKPAGVQVSHSSSQ